ncbi:Histone H1.2 [Bienertia sinuspersici]
MAVAQASKSVKKTTAPKKSKSPLSHPPYIDMITEALVSLKERTGSSHYAIAKHIEEQQKVKDLPPNFKKLLFNQLKKFVASGKLVKVKNSFKLPPGASKKSPATAPAAEKPKPKPKAKETAAAKKPAKKEVTEKSKIVKKAKVAVTVTKKSAKSPAKKVAPAKAKKPKSIKSPAKKATAVKKTPMKKTKK